MKNEIFQRRKRILLIVLFAVSIALAPQAARADDNSSTVKKSVELQSGGWLVREKVNLHSLNFDEDKWVYCIIKVKGHWQKDITNALTWEKSFEHAESIGISIGYKAGDGGGFEAMGSLAANFKTAYKTGSTEQKSESIERSTSYKVPPHTTKRIFVVQTKNIYEMPYTMKGYTLDENGKRISPFEKKDKCIFVGVQSTRILQEPVGKEGQLMAGAGTEVIAEWASELK